MDYPKRKATRLKAYDYSSPGAYFVTICTKDRSCILSKITVGEQLAAPEVFLTAVGKIVEEQIQLLPERFPALTIDRYVIMPNHVHLLIRVAEPSSAGAASCSPTAISAVQALKSLTARMCSKTFGVKPLWQRSFHDHVIRGQRDYLEIWAYIENNPAKWAEDRYYIP